MVFRPYIFIIFNTTNSVTKLELITEIAKKVQAFRQKEQDKNPFQQDADAEQWYEIRKIKEDVAFVLENFFEIVKKTMYQGKGVFLRGFGSFVNKKRAEKKARNIHQNTEVIVQAHFIPTFKPSKSFVGKIKKSEKLLKKLKEDIKK